MASGGCKAAGHGAGLTQDMGNAEQGWVQDQPLGLAPIGAGLRFDLGTEGRWQRHPARGGWQGCQDLPWPRGSTSGVFAKAAGQDTARQPMGATELGMVSASGVGMGHTGWQGYPQPGEMGPRRRGGVWSPVRVWSCGVWSLGCLVPVAVWSPGCPVPTVTMPLPHPTSSQLQPGLINNGWSSPGASQMLPRAGSLPSKPAWHGPGFSQPQPSSCTLPRPPGQRPGGKPLNPAVVGTAGGEWDCHTCKPAACPMAVGWLRCWRQGVQHTAPGMDIPSCASVSPPYGRNRASSH